MELALKYDDKGSERWIIHYSSSHQILIVGDGDLSFSACLATAFGSAPNITATSLDSQDEVMEKYRKGGSNLEMLSKLGAHILHEVDASTMSRHPHLRQRLFDRIVFNFPHAGLTFMSNENDYFQIELHKDVVRGFMRSAREMLTEGGEVHVTHKTAHPFSKWGIEELGNEAGLDLIEKAEFCRGDYPGYINKKGYGRKCNKTFRVGECATFKFTKE